MATLADAITKAQQTYPQLSTARAIVFANVIHNRILTRLNLRGTTKSVSLTSGTKDYALGAETSRIFTAFYRTSATAVYQLEPTSQERLDLERPLWRESTDTGSPTQYLVRPIKNGSGTGDALMVTLVDTPDTTTSGGYPLLEMWVTDSTAFAATSDDLPGALIDEMVYANGIRMLWAEGNDQAGCAFYEQRYNSDMDRCLSWLHNVTLNDPPVMRHSFMTNRRTI